MPPPVTRRLHTPAGLKYGSYAMLLGIISSIVAFLMLLSLTSIDFDTITQENVLQVLAGPLALICIAGILVLVVIIFYLLLLYEMYVGRYEFGEKHATRVSAAIILIIFGVIFTIVTGFFGGGIGTEYTGGPDTFTIDAADFRNELAISSGLGIVGSVAVTLGLVLFALELIGKEKIYLLWVAFGLTVLASVLGTLATLIMLPSEGTLELQDVLRWSAYAGAFSAFSIFGTIVMLLAYRMTRARILSGEVLPIEVPPPTVPPPAWGQELPPATVEEPPKWDELEPAKEPEE
ncbi:MAG: hypothetical protein ACE5IJ_08785 [Thermoplasmata archaeon]